MRRAAGLVGAGIILGAAALISLTLAAVSDQQAIGLGLPAILLITGGLITAAIPDLAVGQRISHMSGYRTGALLSRSLSAILGHQTGLQHRQRHRPGESAGLAERGGPVRRGPGGREVRPGPQPDR